MTNKLKVLECSSRGDKRFSAFYAIVTFNGVTRCIEEHYQMCKRFNGTHAPTMRKAKGRKPTDIVINDNVLKVERLTEFYHYLWYLYLKSNPDLVKFASEFDEFNDMFKGRAYNCQADSIRLFIKNGEHAMYDYLKDFIRDIGTHGIHVNIMRTVQFHNRDKCPVKVGPFVHTMSNTPSDIVYIKSNDTVDPCDLSE